MVLKIRFLKPTNQRPPAERGPGPFEGPSPYPQLNSAGGRWFFLADLPGVTAADLNVDLRDDSLTLTGAVASFEGPEEEDILIEYEVGTYYRQVSLSEVIDQGKIDAQLSDGVLRLSLPKIEKASPRKITVKAG